MRHLRPAFYRRVGLAASFLLVCLACWLSCARLTGARLSGGEGSPRGPDAVRPEAEVRQDHLRVRMMADSLGLIPGRTHQIGVQFKIEPGWHVYAPLRNDSGLPILLTLTAPRGFRFDAPLWPAPADWSPLDRSWTTSMRTRSRSSFRSASRPVKYKS